MIQKRISILVVMAIALTGMFGTSCARPRYWHHRPQRVVRVVTRPAVTVRLVNKNDKTVRLGIALDYLKRHEFITVDAYSRLTGLSLATSAAELKAFSNGRNKVLAAIFWRGERVYVTCKQI